MSDNENLLDQGLPWAEVSVEANSIVGIEYSNLLVRSHWHVVFVTEWTKSTLCITT